MNSITSKTDISLQGYILAGEGTQLATDKGLAEVEWYLSSLLGTTQRAAHPERRISTARLRHVLWM